MKALILAAGGGSRVRSLAAGRPKCLMPLGERPIIEWVIGALTTAGIRDIVMVTGFKAQVLKRALGNGARLNASLTYVHNRNWRKPNGLSVYAARSILGYKETFLTLMSDHLLPASIIRKVAGAPTTKCLLAVDDNVSGVFDLSDATKVRVVDGSPVTIGKRGTILLSKPLLVEKLGFKEGDKFTSLFLLETPFEKPQKLHLSAENALYLCPKGRFSPFVFFFPIQL